jgi:hypothetical protein
MGEMKRSIARDEAAALRQAIDRVGRPRLTVTVIIAAAVIAAVRLARDHNITIGSPRVISVVSDSVSLAKRIAVAVLRSSID